MAWEIEAKWDQDGQTLSELKLEPSPQVIEAEDITLDDVVMACQHLGIDAEVMLFTDEVVRLPKNPRIDQAQGLINTIVLNSEDYDISKMHPSKVKAFLAGITAYFIKASRQK